MSAIRFSEEDLNLFARASGDLNPLHNSSEYAARTYYGQQVVFGVLAAMACIGRMKAPAGSSIARIRAEFLRPVFRDIEYDVEVSGEGETLTARLNDGTVRLVSVSVDVRSSGVRAAFDGEPSFAKTEPAIRNLGDIKPLSTASGKYRCNAPALRNLTQRWGIQFNLESLEILSFCSYMVGMELPGKNALFFKLDVCFETEARRPDQTIDYSAAVKSVNSALGHVRFEFTARAGQKVLAFGDCWSFVRPESIPQNAAASATGASLEGRVVAITGASRGLGAALRRTFESRGASVFSISRSPSESDVHSEAGDAADTQALTRLRARIERGPGKLDFLICNACPPVLPLRLESSAMNRLSDYIHRAVSMTLAPMCVFLDLLDTAEGKLVVISSAAVERPVREWPHYGAAKNAVETLALTAPLQYPRVGALIVRPEKLLTDMTGSPLGRLGASSPDEMAARIADVLAAGTVPAGRTEFLSGEVS